jgi:oxygen-independent coproporphyrinogen-3 oxidase
MVQGHPGKTTALTINHPELAGIYLHIPFCRKACHYCNFHFSTSLKLKNDWFHALLKEIELTPGKEATVSDTVYFGGGTPSLLELEELSGILDTLRRHFTVAPDAEVTLEANPDDITPERAHAWRNAGINRLSIGIQSFRGEDLAWMNRAHDAEQALLAISHIRDAGFANYSIDLIYGVPGLDDKAWLDNVDRAISLGVPHLSCYGLTVEPETALDKMIRLRKKEDVDADHQARQYLMLMERLEKAGYEHYEISNWALPGMRSRHNSAYWKGTPYFGFGPSAHAYDGRARRWNIANNALYIKALERNELPFTEEVLTPVEKFNESVMIALRTAEGIDLDAMRKDWGEWADPLLKDALAFIGQGQLLNEHGYLRLTREGRLFADGIAATLFRAAGE